MSTTSLPIAKLVALLSLSAVTLVAQSAPLNFTVTASDALYSHYLNDGNFGRFGSLYYQESAVWGGPWASVSSTITLDFGESYTLTDLAIGTLTRTAAYYSIETSNDGSDWSSLVSLQPPELDPSGIPQSYYFSLHTSEAGSAGYSSNIDFSPTLARYARLSGSGSDLYAVSEVQFQGVAPVPEPETYAMMFAGLGVLGFMGKRRRKAH
jgi:hypothetical protein